MSELMSDEKIAEMLEQAKRGELPDEQAPARRAPRMHSVDFTRPTKFTNDHERRLKRALTTFCRTASTRLSAELRTGVELEVIDVSQLTWSHAHNQIASGSLCAVIRTTPTDTRMLLSAELPFVLAAIECLLGSSSSVPAKRRLTEIDLALAEHLFDGLLGQLSVVWNDFAGIELELSHIDTQMETAQVAPVSEPTLALTIEARMQGSSFTLALLTPHLAIAPVEDRFLGREAGASAGADLATRERVRGAIGAVDVGVRAEIAGVELSMVDVLALRPGDTLDLRAAVAAGVTLCAEGVPVLRGVPGRSGTRRAVQVTERVEEGQ